MTEWGGSVDFYDFEVQLKDIGFKYVDQGSFRRTFVRNKIVVKVPHNKDGIIDNRVEATAWRKYRDKPTSRGLKLAPCRLLSNGCLLMVKLNLGGKGRYPKWVYDCHTDGRQLGLYKRRYVLYDYACEIPERHKWEKEWGVESEFFSERAWV